MSGPSLATEYRSHTGELTGADEPLLAPVVERIERALTVLDGQPSAEPGRWPPAPLPPAVAPLVPVEPVRAGDDFTGASVAALAAGIAAGVVTPASVVEALIARSERLDPALHAWALLDGERALTAARAPETVARGSLHGVPLGVKDIIDVAGLPTRANSAARASEAPAAADAPVIARLREAGALILGKTATTEFAFMDPSGARNPWNPAHTPGGSSSGSAAGVAARLVPGALGTQTAGSVLRPAAFCGIVGFKPSTERVNRAGVLPLAWSLDHVGTLTRRVADAALLYGAMTGATATPAEERPPRIGLAPAFLSEHTDAATREALARAITRLERAGATPEPVEVTALGPVSLAAHQVIMAAEVSAYHLGAHGDRLDQLGPRLRALIEAGRALTTRALLRAQGVRRLLWEAWNPVLARYDAVLVPSAPGTAPEGLASTGDSALNAPWSLLGVPAITLPVAVAENGLPLGMQLVAAYAEDARLLACAAWCEAALGFEAAPPLA
jgi:Asp-tRNA(Asn)/Glu-tRNA(Gln) amidotransferase A subunit family amidase